MKRIPKGATVAALPLLASLMVGVMGVEAHTGQAVDMKPAVTVTPTPTYDMTPQGVDKVEGDDGSLGGPVYDQRHQNLSKPHYIFKGSSK